MELEYALSRAACDGVPVEIHKDPSGCSICDSLAIHYEEKLQSISAN